MRLLDPSRPVHPGEFSKSLDALLSALRSGDAEQPPDEIPALLGKLAEMKALLEGSYLRPAGTPPAENRLLRVAEAAERLAVSKDYLYRNAHRLPFAVRQGRLLRFRAEGLAEFVRRGARGTGRF